MMCSSVINLYKGNFGPATGGLFRQIQNHTTAFDEQCLDNIHKAVTLAVHLQTENPRDQYSQRSTSNWRGGRGRRDGSDYNYRSDYRSDYRGRSDFDGNYVNRDVPQRPYNNRYNSYSGRGIGSANTNQSTTSQATQYDP